MKWLGLGIVILTPLFPVPARAHSVKAADLVGTWVGNWSGSDAVGDIDTLIFRPDSTYKQGGNGTAGFLRWHHLRGDTLSFGGGPGFRLVLEDQQLSFTHEGDSTNSAVFKFRRVNVPTPKP